MFCKNQQPLFGLASSQSPMLQEECLRPLAVIREVILFFLAEATAETAVCDVWNRFFFSAPCQSDHLLPVLTPLVSPQSVVVHCIVCLCVYERGKRLYTCTHSRLLHSSIYLQVVHQGQDTNEAGCQGNA